MIRVDLDDPLWVPLSALPRLCPVGLHVADAWCDRALVVRAHDEEIEVLPFDGRTARHATRTGWHLHFGDAATRDRAVRWLGRRYRLGEGSTAPMWLQRSDFGPRWLIKGARGATRIFTGAVPTHVDDGDRRAHWIEVPDLALLQRSDDRLPDGSRRVDAEALAAVCWHVGAS